MHLKCCCDACVATSDMELNLVLLIGDNQDNMAGIVTKPQAEWPRNSSSIVVRVNKFIPSPPSPLFNVYQGLFLMYDEVWSWPLISIK